MLTLSEILAAARLDASYGVNRTSRRTRTRLLGSTGLVEPGGPSVTVRLFRDDAKGEYRISFPVVRPAEQPEAVPKKANEGPL